MLPKLDEESREKGLPEFLLSKDDDPPSPVLLLDRSLEAPPGLVGPPPLNVDDPEPPRTPGPPRIVELPLAPLKLEADPGPPPMRLPLLEPGPLLLLEPKAPEPGLLEAGPIPTPRPGPLLIPGPLLEPKPALPFCP